MADDENLTQRPNNLRAEYGEVCANIRWLADIRFKLLGLIPLATILGAWFSESSEYVINPLIALFGLVVTFALLIYNERNDQHYGELIGRAKELEQELGLYGGQFSQRSSAYLKLFGVTVNHNTGVYLIYKASMAVWAFGVIYPILYHGCRLLVGPDSVNILALNLLSLVFAVVAIWVLFYELEKRKKAREDQMRETARAAMGIIVPALPQFPQDDGEARWDTAFQHLQDTGGKSFSKEQDREEWMAGARDYRQVYAELKPPTDPPGDEWNEKRAAYLAAVVSGLSARWFRTMYRQHRIKNSLKSDSAQAASAEESPSA